MFYTLLSKSYFQKLDMIVSSKKFHRSESKTLKVTTYLY